MKHSGYLLCTLAIVLGLAPLTLHAQTDVAASVYGAFSPTTQPSSLPIGTTESPSNAAGVLLEVRHIVNPFVGFEGTYSYNRANRAYSYKPMLVCPAQNPQLPCGPAEKVTSVPANAHEITGDWVFSMKLANLRPFALAGGGVLRNVPTESTVTGTEITCGPVAEDCVPSSATFSTRTQTTGVFVYGAGLDWTLLPHLGLRFQYRGNLYKAPDMVQVFTSLNSFTHLRTLRNRWLERSSDSDGFAVPHSSKKSA